MNATMLKFSPEEKQKFAESVIGEATIKLLANIKEANAEDGRFKVVFTSGSLDRHGETVNPDGWDFTNYMKNPVVLYAHDYCSLPIGMVEKITRDGDNWIAEGMFASADMSPMAGYVAKLYKAGFIKTVSVGFLPTEMDAEYNSLKQELLEISFVPVPANPDALSLAKQLGLDVEELKTKGIFVEAKTAVPPKDTPMADEGEAWDAAKAESELAKWASSDGSGEKDKMDWAKYQQGFAWFDSENAESFGAYKLPHHMVVDSELQVVWAGVSAAMGAVLGARGGVEIPETEREAVYNHLKGHYDQFSKEAPEFKAAAPEEDEKSMKIKSLEDEVATLKAGRVLSEANRTLIKDTADGLRMATRSMDKCVSALEDLLKSTEPSSGDNQDPSEGGQKGVNIVVVQRLIRIADKSIEDALRLIGRDLKK